MICKFEPCEMPAHCKGWCKRHYSQQKAGYELTLPAPRMPEWCAFPECVNRTLSKSLCSAHYSQMSKGKELKPLRTLERHWGCAFPECDREHYALGLCRIHWAQQNNGIELKPEGRAEPKWFLRGGYLSRSRRVGGRNVWELQHRILMEEHLGRKLLPHENVHHLNGVRHDNRIENLEIWSTSQPAGQRIPDKVAHAKYILGLYEPSALAPDDQEFKRIAREIKAADAAAAKE